MTAMCVDLAGSADSGSHPRSTKPVLNAKGAMSLGIFPAAVWLSLQSEVQSSRSKRCVLRLTPQAMHAEVDTSVWRDGDDMTAEQLNTCQAMHAAYNCQYSGTLDWLLDSSAVRHMSNDVQISVAT